MSIERDDLLRRIREQYTGSRDFNGLPVQTLDQADSQLVEAVIELIHEGEVDLVRGDGHPNPHIKAMAADSVEEQIRKIEEGGLGTGCLYPTEMHLMAHDAGADEDAPYTRELKLGTPQLDFRAFDLRILEWYRNDPRYYYEVDDIHGQIHQRPGTEGPDGRVVQDRLEFLQFGFAYNDAWDRAVAVFLRYLHDLPTDQQQYLANHQLAAGYKLHPDFFRTQIIGDFPERVSIYDAFLEEKRIINEMCARMDKAPLFRTNNKAYERPPGFGILVRPTKKEYGDVALMLDQLLSDDLNRDFFRGDIPLSETLARDDGSTVTHPIGTITLLEQWLKARFRPKEPEAMEELIRNIRFVRKERQKPAHKADDNAFDQEYLKEQRELINKAFVAVRTIRMVFENHPRVKGHEIPDWLREGKIWTK